MWVWGDTSPLHNPLCRPPPPQDATYGGHSATLPRNYKVSPLAGERRAEGPFRRPAPGTLPRGWHCAQQPVSRIPVPPQGGRPPRHKPLPLSMIFKLQNAFWEQGGGGPRGLPPGPPAGPRTPQKQPQLLALPQAPSVPPGGEGEGAEDVGAVGRAGVCGGSVELEWAAGWGGGHA